MACRKYLLVRTVVGGRRLQSVGLECLLQRQTDSLLIGTCSVCRETTHVPDCSVHVVHRAAAHAKLSDTRLLGKDLVLDRLELKSRKAPASCAAGEWLCWPCKQYEEEQLALGRPQSQVRPPRWESTATDGDYAAGWVLLSPPVSGS